MPRNMKKLKVSLLLFYDCEGKILLNHRRDNLHENEDVREIIGGGIDQGESPSDAIKREIYEELGYIIDETKDNLKFVQKFGDVSLFKAKFPEFQSFSDTNEVKLSDLKLFSVKEALALKLLPMTRKILERIELGTF